MGRLPELLQPRAWQAERLLKHAQGPVVVACVVQVQPHLQRVAVRLMLGCKAR